MVIVIVIMVVVVIVVVTVLTGVFGGGDRAVHRGKTLPSTGLNTAGAPANATPPPRIGQNVYMTIWKPHALAKPHANQLDLRMGDKVRSTTDLPGVASGTFLVFVICLGFYITPALVGGPTDQMISGFIFDAINRENNWGKASALGVILLVATVILYYVYNKLVGIDRMKLG